MKQRILTTALFAFAACGGSDKRVAEPAGATGGVHAVDWMNRDYAYAWNDEEGANAYTVKDGSYADPDDPMYLWVTGPAYGDLTGDGQDEAALIVDAKAGDSLHYPKLVVFTADGAGVKVLATLDLGEVSGQVGVVEDVAVANGAVTFTRYDNKDGEDFRTASLKQRETWKWNGTELAEDEAARTTEPYSDPDAEPVEDEPSNAE